MCMERKTSITITDAFLKKLKESNHKTNKMWVDKGGEFYNRSIILFLQNNIEMYSAHNGGKPVVAERFIRTLKNKIYKHITSR